MKKYIIVIIALITGLGLTGCTDDGGTEIKGKITVGASITPHAEILRECKEYVKKQGYILEIVEFDSYILPNIGVEEGSLDANYFQHSPYLNEYNEKNGTDLVAVKNVHIEPLGLYTGISKNIDNIPNGASIAIPDDTSNGARALILLHELEIITLDLSKGLAATKNDILNNPYNITIVELASETIATHLPDLNYGIINGNNALLANIIDKAIAFESAESALAYVNVLCVRGDKVDDVKTRVLIEALSQPNIAEFILERFKVFVAV